MSEKIKILEHTAKKLSNDIDYMSFVLYKYLELENTSQQDLIETLNCTLEEFFKLSLCKVPDTTANDYLNRLKNVCDYSHASLLEVNKIIKRVDTIYHLSNIKSGSSILIAARDKRHIQKDNGNN